MFWETIKGILDWVGALSALVAVLSIMLNELLYGTWYGETEQQRRERIRKERNARAAAARERE